MENKIQAVYDDTDDDVKFINIYSKGRSELGRALSHFYHLPFEHPVFGKFNCMEGFWHYVGGNPRDERLRTAPGYIAKKIGKTLEKKYDPEFRKLIMEGNRAKIESSDALKKDFTESTLPFVHYYIAPTNGWVIKPKAQEWLCQGFEDLRNEYRIEAGLAPNPKSPYT